MVMVARDNIQTQGVHKSLYFSHPMIASVERLSLRIYVVLRPKNDTSSTNYYERADDEVISNDSELGISKRKDELSLSTCLFITS